MLNDGHRYSFSQLQSFDTCPYSFYLARIEKEPQKENAFSQYGSLMHSLIERWANHEIATKDLPGTWDIEYPVLVTEPWPRFLAAKNYASKAFEQGRNYLVHFDEFAGYTILDVEKRFATDIGGRPFVGIIDMLLKNDVTGEFVLLDHKSKSKPAFRSAADEMYKQTLLYSKYVFEEYGTFPDILRFNLFKEGIYEERPFTKDAFENALRWATDVIQKIESYDFIDWLKSKEQDFFCQNLCGSRNSCPNGKELRKYPSRTSKKKGG